MGSAMPSRSVLLQDRLAGIWLDIFPFETVFIQKAVMRLITAHGFWEAN